MSLQNLKNSGTIRQLIKRERVTFKDSHAMPFNQSMQSGKGKLPLAAYMHCKKNVRTLSRHWMYTLKILVLNFVNSDGNTPIIGAIRQNAITYTSWWKRNKAPPADHAHP
jgi:hypothetical protein